SNMAGRQAEVEAAEDMVRQELDEVEGWFRTLTVKPTLTAIRDRAEAMARAELERTWSKRLSHLGEEDKASMEKMVEALVAKLLHPTMSALRASASNGDGTALVSAARTLHGLEADEAEDA
ncbi:MAG: hypothetical protein QF464_18600, partial [Myxococcota bacterium]|nr:hypothetical protein [Myxococcota bacterium]